MWIAVMMDHMTLPDSNTPLADHGSIPQQEQLRLRVGNVGPWSFCLFDLNKYLIIHSYASSHTHVQSVFPSFRIHIPRRSFASLAASSVPASSISNPPFQTTITPRTPRSLLCHTTHCPSPAIVRNRCSNPHRQVGVAVTLQPLRPNIPPSPLRF